MIVLVSACAEPPALTVTAAPSALGVRVEANRALTAVELRDGDAVVLRRRLDTPSATVDLFAAVPSGTYTIQAVAGEETAEARLAIGTPPPLRVQVQVSPSEPWVEGEGEIAVPVVRGGAVEVRVGVTTDAARSVETSLGEAVVVPTAGERVVRTVRVVDVPVEVTVGDTRFRLAPKPVDPGQFAIAGVVFPAGPDGTADIARPASRVTLPAGWWDDLVRGLGLGGRRRDAYAPWAWHAVTVRNASDATVDVVVQARVQRKGADDLAFRPRLRDADGGTGIVRALLRVPASGSATAALPLFVDARTVADGEAQVVTEVTGLGSATPLSTRADPLYVVHGDTLSLAGFSASLVVAAAGLAWTARRLRGWLETSATGELMTVALFGAALFVVGSAADLITMAVGAVLGPFAPLVTGLVSDLGRTVLLGTLVALLPRPGVLAMAFLTGYLLRGLALGSVAPADAVYVGVSVAAQEGFAWTAGLTRGRSATFPRLALAFGGAAVVTSLAGLWVHVVLYRLYFAGWYVALQVLVPGLLYTVVAAWFATGFATSLRRVDA